MVTATNLGFPRIGVDRELKRALEDRWSGKISHEDLLTAARRLRLSHWRLQKDAGLDQVPCGDFSLYDHVLDAAVLAGAVPRRYADLGADAYFAMARGRPALPALEMTKWFDTNYHHIVPELERGQAFRLSSEKPFEEHAEARAAGIPARPVLLGPVSFLLLSKGPSRAERLALLPALLPVYEAVLARLAREGAPWVQVDEPCLALDLDAAALAAYASAYGRLGRSGPKVLLAAYFARLGENLLPALRLPVAGLHLDLAAAPEQLEAALAAAPAGLVLSLGVVDGRNVWRADLDRALAPLERAAAALGPDRLMVAPSCSLLHCPVDLNRETLDPELKSWMAFAGQKLQEVALLARALNQGRFAVAAAFEENRAALASRRRSPRLKNPAVRARLGEISPAHARRKSPYAVRAPLQRARLGLPPLPATTIGSFPQTEAIRQARSARRAGRLSAAEYEKFLQDEIRSAVRFQDEIGLDVLVHGEPERNDMVEYFGEKLEGFAFTSYGWVQSYGSRCVKPPVIYGDVSRPAPMTVDWARFAQSLTDKPMKGMLTGPVTVLQWSFVRDDQPRRDTCRQIALALRDEVADLEAAGLRVIQIDEPALREGLPLRVADHAAYLDWAVEAFRLASSPVADATQIHTHMCYADFDDIIEAVAALDADVISLEASRSGMGLLEAFRRFSYPNQVGPGLYDIHSPRVPSVEEQQALLARALEVVPLDRLWVNPDCGLKTRRWEEVKPALKNMVEAARRLRPAPARAG